MADVTYDTLDRLLGGRSKRETPCPFCSHQRKAAHRKSLCFGLMRRSDTEIVFHCMNCQKGGKVSADWQEGGTRKPVHVPRSQPRRAESVEPQSTAHHAAMLWRRAKPTAGTIAEAYWSFRNLTPPIPPTIRFLDQPQPMLVIAVGMPELAGDSWDPPTLVSGVQRIFLKPDGLGKAGPPKSLGSIKGLPCVVHCNPESVALVIGEGVEKTHAAAAAMNVDGWSACGVSFLPALAEVIPDVFEVVTILRDPGVTKEVDELARRLAERGIEPQIVQH